MSLDPVLISLLALILSILSLGISMYQNTVDRRLQWEQMRGKLHSRLTSNTLELAIETEELLHEIQEMPDEKVDRTVAAVKKLQRIMGGFMDMRKDINTLKSLPAFTTSVFIKRFAPIQSDIDDTEIILRKLIESIDRRDIGSIHDTADGLLERIFGSNKEIPERDV